MLGCVFAGVGGSLRILSPTVSLEFGKSRIEKMHDAGKNGKKLFLAY